MVILPRVHVDRKSGQSTKVSRRSANGDGRVHIWVTTRWMSMSSMARMTPKKAVGT